MGKLKRRGSMPVTSTRRTCNTGRARVGRKYGCRGQSRPMRRVVRVWAEQEKDDGSEFMNSPVGKFISSLSEFAASSPINKGKIALAKAQAGDYDVASTKKELAEIIDGSNVVMFSFPK